MSHDQEMQDSLIDLISERHQTLRKILETAWNKKEDMQISNTEWFILAKVYQKPSMPLSKVTKNVSISRQAIHKQVKNLQAKELIKVGNVSYNKKEKSLQLTTKGIEYYEKYVQLKSELEKNIASQIGEEEIILLKNLLYKDWAIDKT